MSDYISYRSPLSMERELSAQPLSEDIVGTAAQLDRYISSGGVELGAFTLGLIRPNLHDELLVHHTSDGAAAMFVEEHISGLGIATKFSTVFGVSVMDQFYGEARDRNHLLDIPPDRHAGYTSKWHEYVGMMTSGPLTVLVLHDVGLRAVEKWRSHLGHWDIETHRDPSTIRGRLGKSNYNNLIHGSDSPASAIREMGIIRDHLLAQIPEEREI